MNAGDVERFWEQTIPEPNTGCWLWMGNVKPTGYGNTKRDGKTISAHRMAWFIARGPLPPRTVDVCHRCDVRCCVNPAHLFLGTRADNLHDMWRKGRGHKVRGEKHGRHRLQPEQVLAIRAECARGVSQYALAERFGVTPMTISNIHCRASWRHLS